jgi:hypothetical protein
MKARLMPIAALALAATVSACASAPSLPRLAAAQSPGAQPLLGLSHAPQACGSDDGGFGAPVRHFGNATPFSENPFDPCWLR